ncbi:Crp/Fnr family transcriptional regulator [Sphingobacterium faecium]|uniref:Crp/Fnr family transcriptional regulator n=1 Tax=Sphingobacterium faecium TaxID=34087 RepID=UPI00247847E4|nr:Crp/Fnr family transcriptional regulator [Sphingobacterium faecium]WGQ13808.1 Crp/Fnr family transcriptional regulator [Sphingobacterium faecium]
MTKIDLDQAQAQILHIFNSIYPMSEALEKSIRQHSKLTTFRKKSHLLQFNEVNKSIYFILQGCVRTYYLNDEGEEHTSWLLTEGELAISVYSFYSQQKSFEAIEALEDCVTLELTHTALSHLYQQHLEFNVIGRYLTEQYYIESESKANALRMLSAKERYHELILRKPQILRRVPLGYIASYLGITQSTLSRIRTKI